MSGSALLHMHMRRPLLLIVALAATASATGSNASNFEAGLVCSGLDMTLANASSMLRGRHLKVCDAVWAPFASKDPTAPHGWRGLDMDLIQSVSDLLGFTYSVHEITSLPGEMTWTPMLYRSAPECDLVLSYWARTTERLDRVVMLAGHVDMSATLVARLSRKEVTLADSMFSFLQPFSEALWACILAMILCAGFIDFLLERRSSSGGVGSAWVALGGSLYEYTGGALWGGFEYAKSFSSGIYQIFMGFSILVIISAYTANLAAFMTVSAGSTLSVTSIDSAMAAERPPEICSYWNPLISQVSSTYDSLALNVMGTNAEAANALAQLPCATGACDAVIAPKITYDIWRTDPNYCDLRPTETLFTASAGWVTNRESSCVQLAVDYAFESLAQSGELDRLRTAWLPETGCSVAGSALSSSSACRRRLESTGDADAAAVLAPPRPRRPSNRRSLRGGGGGGGGAASEGGPSEDVRKLTVVDFAGLFIMFGIISVAIVVGFELHHRCGSCFKELFGCLWSWLRCKPESLSTMMSRVKKGATDAVTGEGGEGEKDVFDLTQVSTENEAQMLTLLLRQMRQLRSEMNAGHDDIKTKVKSFKQVDTDGDGFISKAEAVAYYTSDEMGFTKTEALEMFDEQDIDKDGQLSRAEWKAAHPGANGGAKVKFADDSTEAHEPPSRSASFGRRRRKTKSADGASEDGTPNAERRESFGRRRRKTKAPDGEEYAAAGEEGANSVEVTVEM